MADPHPVFKAQRDTTVGRVKVAAGERVGGVCDSVGKVTLPAVYEVAVRHGAGGELYWGRRLDTGLVDFITENPRKRRYIATATPYNAAWNPLLNGTADTERTVFFAGVVQADGTFWVDIIGADGVALGSMPGVTDIVAYRGSYLVSSRHDFGETHQVVSIDGELLTPLLPKLKEQGDNWVCEAEDELVLPVLPNGQVGRSTPRIQGNRSLGPWDHSWAFAAVWTLPDGSTAYGLTDGNFGTVEGGVFLSLKTEPNGYGKHHIIGQHQDGTWQAFTIDAHYPSHRLAEAFSHEGLREQLNAINEEMVERLELSRQAFEAEMEERRRRQAAKEAALQKAMSAPPTTGWVDPNQGYRSCTLAYDERDQLTLDEAHHAMKNCYDTLPYSYWLAIDRIYMKLQAGPPVQIAPVQPIYRSRQQDQAAISQQRFDDDLDRYMSPRWSPTSSRCVPPTGQPRTPARLFAAKTSSTMPGVSTATLAPGGAAPPCMTWTRSAPTPRSFASWTPIWTVGRPPASMWARTPSPTRSRAHVWWACGPPSASCTQGHRFGCDELSADDKADLIAYLLEHWTRATRAHGDVEESWYQSTGDWLGMRPERLVGPSFCVGRAATGGVPGRRGRGGPRVPSQGPPGSYPVLQTGREQHGLLAPKHRGRRSVGAVPA